MTISDPDLLMNDKMMGSDASHDRFDQVEAILASYPDVTEAEIKLLKHWFRKEASAFEVASMASKDSCQKGYLQFRADHVDRFTAGDWIVVAVVIACPVFAAIAYALFAT